MNHISGPLQLPYDVLFKHELFRILEAICQTLELTDAQYEEARRSYEAVAAWLSASDDPILQSILIYAHGSVALGTTVRPRFREDFDVDLICLVFAFSAGRSPAELKRLIGDRLRASARYQDMLEEKKRCWRLNYAREFHLDVSPTVMNPACGNGGELVPDKQLRAWKPTNPKGYKALFERRCALRVSFRQPIPVIGEARAEVETFPARQERKGILRRIVQLLKRHRDIAFAEIEADIAPISIIVTTLAAQSYEYCVGHFPFDTEFDLLIATIRMMPHFIEHPVIGGKRLYLIANETTSGENFAEGWNTAPERAAAFYRWHSQALADFELLAGLQGIDVVSRKLRLVLGENVVQHVMDERTGAVSRAREKKSLFVAPGVGLSLTSSAQATQVPRNTNFGD